MTQRNLFLILSMVLVGLSLSDATFAQTGIKIVKKTQMQIPGMPTFDSSKAQTGNAKKAIEAANNINKPKMETVYLKNSRMRTDSQGIGVSGGIGAAMIGMAKMVDQTNTEIVQCDKQRTITFNSRKKKYLVSPFDSGSPTTSAAKNNASDKSGKGVVNVVNTITDTGERMKLFGYEARHLKQSMTFSGDKNSCLKGTMKMEVDGWYADIPEFSCPLKSEMTQLPQSDGDCDDEFRVTTKGVLNGIALKEIRTMTMEGQKEAIVQKEEVVELTKVALDTNLFEPPADYSPANSKAELKTDENSDSSTGNSPNNPSPMPKQGDGNYTANPTLAPPLAGTSGETPVAAKKAGTIRIGVLTPKAEFTQSKKQAKSGESTDNSALIQANFLKNLNSQNIEAIALEGETLFEANAQAKQMNCDYLLVSSLDRKKGGGMFSQIVPMVVGSVIPGGELLGLIKAKDKIILEYQLIKAENNVPILNGKLEAKAAKDGEDIISPLILQSATAILLQVKKNQ